MVLESIMLMGTSSHVGKSILTTALCRIFYREGRRVVPFKAQNMALNSYVTKDGLEMGRAQVAQAEAAGLEPMVDMNPVLLKPTGNSRSQVILAGRSIGTMSAREYHAGYSLEAFGEVKAALARLQQDFDTLVVEGAGSPAEVNLKSHDIVNMRVAKYLHAPVLLIADIDRGGALASLVGTLELLDEEERALVKGLVINKFRGDVSLFTPAVDFLEEKTGKPVLGIVPYIEDMGIDDEDSVSLEEREERQEKKAADEPDVEVTYVRRPEELGSPNLIILPGSKNTTEDLLFVRESGLEAAIRTSVEAGTPLIGICGGYQMLGEGTRLPADEDDLCRAEAHAPGHGRLPGHGVLWLHASGPRDGRLRDPYGRDGVHCARAPSLLHPCGEGGDEPLGRCVARGRPCLRHLHPRPLRRRRLPPPAHQHAAHPEGPAAARHPAQSPPAERARLRASGRRRRERLGYGKSQSHYGGDGRRAVR